MRLQTVHALRLLAAGLMTSSLVACFQTRDTTLPPSAAQVKSAGARASEARGNHQEVKAPRYTIVDLGTLGGTFSQAGGLNNRGWVAGTSTPTSGYTVHAFLWRNGKMIDVGSAGQPNSATSESEPINDEGAVTGYLDTATPDPEGENFCGFGYHICLPFVWHKGAINVLPLPGGNNGQADQINDEWQIVGTGETSVPDPNCQSPQVYDLVATVWGPKKGQLRTLPPYGSDTEAAAFGINDKGEVVGTSGNCALLSKSFGYVEAILWRNGRPINLGNLGGGVFNTGFGINNKSEVTGQAEVTLYGAFHAYLWQHGVMRDLGTFPGDMFSLGNAINDRTQIVGLSWPYGTATYHGFLWQEGAMYDLNTLIPKHSDISVLEALGINERGQIAGWGFDRNTYELRGFLATPCDRENPDHKGCEDTRGASTSAALPESVRRTLIRWNALHHIH